MLQEFELERIAVLDIGLRRPTLDDVFLSLTGHVAEEVADEDPGATATDLPDDARFVVKEDA